MIANKKPLTKEQIEDLAKRIYNLLKENDMWVDTFIYFNGKRLGNKSPDGHYQYDGSAFIEENMDPKDYFDYVNPNHILSMSYEGPVYDMINYDEYPSVLKKFNSLFDECGLYYIRGNSWNFSCYYRWKEKTILRADYSMNLCKIYVSNIVSDIKDEKYKGHTLVCDTNCWGHVQYGVETYLNSRQYKEVIDHGYYMG